MLSDKQLLLGYPLYARQNTIMGVGYPLLGDMIQLLDALGRPTKILSLTSLYDLAIVNNYVVDTPLDYTSEDAAKDIIHLVW